MSVSREKYQYLLSLYKTEEYNTASKEVAKALRVSPKDPNLLHLAAQIAETQGEKQRAIMFYRRALESYPGWLEARFNLATVLNSQNQYAEAIAFMTEIVNEKPELPQAQEALAKFYQSSGNLIAALRQWEKAIALFPEQYEWQAQYYLLARQLCDWKTSATNINSFPPQATIVLSDDPALQKENAEKYSQKKFGNIKPLPFPAWKPHKRLRVGYLSSDFHSHATAYLLAELFELHNRSEFEVFAYSYGVDDQSQIRTRLKENVEHFIELNNLTGKKAAEQIRNDEIDILVDLKGHTRGSRLEIMAFRPAAIQIHWLGYPGTTGTTFIDYFIADKITVPENEEIFFTEKVLRLPNCYQINDRQRAIATPKLRSEYGLPDKVPVLASFNQTYKITPEIFSLWCNILRELPGAILWLYESNQYAPDNLLQAAQENGIDASRLIFAPPLPLDQHLARYAFVDLALDTHPVGGHTTTSDALWAGVPVVTLTGNSFVSRVATSVLNSAELSQLAVSTPEIYKSTVLNLIRNQDAISNLKGHLKTKRLFLPLFNTQRFAKDWETLLLNIKNGR